MWKSVLTLAVLFSGSLPLLAQNYPMPSKVGEPAAICTGCGGSNSAGELNAGKPTFAYDAPLTNHVGRVNDSNSTGLAQNQGMRPLRAGKVRIATSARGSAPPRVYMQLGETFAAYSLSTFFTTTLAAPLIPVNQIPVPRRTSPWGGRNPFEKIAMFDAYFYPESSAANWDVPLADNTDRLKDFDFDDRGNVYVAEDEFGWGIAKDAGETGGDHMVSLVQVASDPNSVEPGVVFVLKSGSKYYAFISDDDGIHKVSPYDVTNPSSPVSLGVRTGSSVSILRWAKDEDARVIAVVNRDGKLRLYDYDAYIAGTSPKLVVSPASGRVFRDAAFDDKGHLWAIESTANALITSNDIRKLTPAGSGYSDTTISNPYPAGFAPVAMHANAGYVAVTGFGTNYILDLHLFKIEGNGLQLVDTNGFFRKYYHGSPSGYAEPGAYVDIGQNEVHIFKNGTKTYLFYHPYGLGDVYELASGPTVSATMKTTSFGTVNLNAQPTQTGPFPGDLITFRATTTGAAQSVDWNFGNTEAGSAANIRSNLTGADIIHQYTGLNTSTKVTQTKSVKASFTSDPSVSDTISVALKLPEARIAIKGIAGLITSSGFETAHGEKFVDASDGSVESHFATWAIGPTPGTATSTNLLPNAEIAVGLALGPHAVVYTGSYGKYDGNFGITSPYVTSIASKSYTVLPFLAKIKDVTRVGSTVTYGATARYTTDPLFLSATQWTYRWSLTTAAGAETAFKTDTIAVGPNIPDFPFDKALLVAANGGKVTLTITVAPGGVPSQAYETYSTFANVVVPVPIIQLTNCTNASGPCSLLATAASGSTATWQLTWSVEHNSAVVKSGTGNPLAFTLPASAGSYTATVTETVFDVSAFKTFTVQETLCGPPPSIAQLSITAGCTSSCPANSPISFSASTFGYTNQACDEFSWTFGDGGTATGKNVSHTYTTSGNKTVNLTVRNSSNQTGTTVSETVQIGTVVVPPTCTAPAGIAFTTNCVSGSTCKAGTAMQFTGRRGLGSLLSCDNAQWTFGDGTQSSSKTPSKTYSSAGTYTVKVTVSNTSGSSSYQESVVIVPGTTTGCSGSASEANVSLSFSAATSGCSSSNTKLCNVGESIAFNATLFGYTQQTCDQFLWTFGDNATSTSKNATHTYAANGSYAISLKVYNSTNPTGVTLTDTVLVGEQAPAKPVPVLSFASFPTTGAKDSPVTFTVNSNIRATGWFWTFGDGKTDSTQATVVGTSTSIQHTYTTSGTFSVSVKARNSEDVATAQTGTALGTGLVITDVPEYKFLLPVVTHGAGQNNSVWRTDVQIYNPDPNVSPQSPMIMSATLRDIHRTLEVFNSTFTYEDFMKVFTTASDSGPVIITVRSRFTPQIWTRTYNQTETGTFGQFIPAIRIDPAAGSASAFGDGKYYMAGLRHDARFRTNLGFVNPNAQTINATVKVYDDNQLLAGQFTLQLPQYQLDQFPITAAKGVPNLSPNRPFSIEIEVPPGQWLIAYASFIDSASNDPVYIQAIRESELTLTDYRQGVIPGVGHVGEWRSDITIFNPDSKSIVVDLAYHDQTGAKVAEAKNVLIHSSEFLQYADFLKQGILGNVPDSLGVLRVTVPDSIAATRFPLTFARTYNDKGTGKTFGQGIGGFAAARANVKPGKPALVPGIRSNSKYYTNVGVTNVSSVPVVATVKLLDPTTGAEQHLQTHNLQPNQSVVGRVVMPGLLETGSLKIEVTGGNVWAFASIVDIGTTDPEYVAATPLP